MLRDYQTASIDALYDYFREHSGNPLVVAPTGSGKSHIIAGFVQRVFSEYPDQTIVMLTHRKELIEQNAGKLLAAWPGAPLGIYSAGLRSKQIAQITFGGIQSLYKKANHFSKIDLVIIDECHLVPHSGDGQYQKFLKVARKQNPYLKVIGFTATPYRLKGGLLTDGDARIFTDIAYEIEIDRLIDAKHLVPLVGKSPETQADLTEVRTRMGEFVLGDLEKLFENDALTEAAIDEIFKFAGNRKSWLIFCAGVKHSETVSEALRKRNISAESITGETLPMLRDKYVGEFKTGQLQVITNCDVLTTGFNAPNVDLIVFLRPTKSTALYVQMSGRGMRNPEQYNNEKTNCMVLDFVGNIKRHGPVNAVSPKKQTPGAGEGAKTKTCPECRTEISIFLRECPECGHEFTSELPLHEPVAANDPPLARNEPYSLAVFDVNYTAHVGRKSKTGVPTLRVNYTTSTGRVSEYICLEHSGFAGAKARIWWNKNATGFFQCPKTVDEAVLIAPKALKTPKQIWVKDDGRFLRVLSYVFYEPGEEGEFLL